MFRRRALRAKPTPAAADRPAVPELADRGPGRDPGRDPGHDPGHDPELARRDTGPFGAAAAGIDVSVPHPSRIRNFWLGGREYFAADRAAGEAIGREFPHLPEIARAERAFLVRAVRLLAGPARIRQFLDVGAGLPAGGNTHEIAQRIAPEIGIVYADHDPVVLMHAKALLAAPILAGSPTGAVSYIDADLRDVAAVLAGAAGTLDMTKPVALIMAGVLGYLDDFGAARSIVSQLVGALPAGSYLAIADGVAGDERTDRDQQRYNGSGPAPYVLRRPDELASFFDGLDLIEPGVVPCSRWRPDGRDATSTRPDSASFNASFNDAARPEAPAYGGVARKP
jgi:S-adenosyl methyltransferase